jgi:hypothetical protein
MKKVIINNCYGGFSLSEEAYKFLSLEWDRFGYKYNDKRDDPKLIECVEKLGEKANGRCAELKIVEIPEDVEYQIKEYDGSEWIAENHRTWG